MDPDVGGALELILVVRMGRRWSDCEGEKEAEEDSDAKRGK
jgi:hypothetical protein